MSPAMLLLPLLVLINIICYLDASTDDAAEASAEAAACGSELIFSSMTLDVVASQPKAEISYLESSEIVASKHAQRQCQMLCCSQEKCTVALLDLKVKNGRFTCFLLECFPLSECVFKEAVGTHLLLLRVPFELSQAKFREGKLYVNVTSTATIATTSTTAQVQLSSNKTTFASSNIATTTSQVPLTANSTVASVSPYASTLNSTNATAAITFTTIGSTSAASLSTQASSAYSNYSMTTASHGEKKNVKENETKVVFVSFVSEFRERSSTIFLISALCFGVIFVVTVLMLTARKLRDSWQRRHYSKLDYLINDVYN